MTTQVVSVTEPIVALITIDPYTFVHSLHVLLQLTSIS